MEKFKDFLYNKNDIVVAIVILAIALTVIAFRVMDIMKYPAERAQQQADAVQSVQQQDEQTDSEATTDNNAAEESDDEAASDENATEEDAQ